MQELVRITKQHFMDSKGSHDWDHCVRVRKMALHLAKKEGADSFVVEAAAILHDIAREKEDEARGSISHAELGSDMAMDILERLNFSKGIIDNVSHCIRTHSYRGKDKAETIEAKVLFDADKLDSIGAIGIGRAFLFAGEIGAKLHDKDTDPEKCARYSKDDTAYREFLVKLRKVKESMLTKEGKRIAEERHKFMEDFFKRLNKEVEGKI